MALLLTTQSAVVSAADQLTPAGAEASASADGVIPAWVPPGPQGAGWTYGQLRSAAWKFKGDKPLYTIDASNYEKYASTLSPGHVDMFKRIKGYKMEVYPTRRSCGQPDFVIENTKKNVGFAKIDKTGAGLEEAYLPGIPFPQPKSGVEVMWNMKSRYKGVALVMPKASYAISPRKGSEDWISTVSEQVLYYPWGAKGSNLFSATGHIESYAYFLYAQPAALSGQAAVFTLKATDAIEVFYYFPGQRRVRRMPSYAYDAPSLGSENQYNIDEAGVFYGALDRFDWKIVGKKEMIVPYNAFGLYDFKAKMSDVAKPDGIDSSHRRYETHRVWVVEATVKSGMRHVAPKRTFYIDEDSWNGLVGVDYDAQGKISKVREGSPIPVYETGTCDVAAFTQYNLNDGRYLFDMTSLAAGTDSKWVVDAGNNEKLKQSFYTSDNLRAISDR
jgi:hypothetical protein